jgi:hypothetical protein
MKRLTFDGKTITISDPKELHFENSLDEVLYGFIYQRLTDGSDYRPQINADALHDGSLGINIKQLFLDSGIKIKPPSVKATNQHRLFDQHIIRDFISRFPVFLGIFQNVVVLADQAIKNAEILAGEEVNSKNFIKIKGVIDEVNRKAWSRVKGQSESQSGVSTLGTISETLLKIIFGKLVDKTTFFKVDQSQVQSYGDFVLMCLPNKLWLSVKSNFARERLLASGYTNDILGVGFFKTPLNLLAMFGLEIFKGLDF